ncbi:MAG: IS5 family transposase [Leptothrix sp. (in: b-proteobacteria)]
MKQSDLGLNLTTKRTRKREFLDEMNRVVPWGALVELITPYAPEGRRGRPPFAVEVMLHLHFMQQWFTLSDPAMEEALHDTPMFREFACLTWDNRLPDVTTILRFRRLLEDSKLAPQILGVFNALLGAKGLTLRTGTVVDATLIAAPSSTKNARGERDPEIKQSEKGNQWFFGMKAHIGVDAESGLVHTVRGTTGSVNDMVEANSLLHGDEVKVFGDAGYQGAHKRVDAKPDITWHVAMRPGKRKPASAFVPTPTAAPASNRSIGDFEVAAFQQPAKCQLLFLTQDVHCEQVRTTRNQTGFRCCGIGMLTLS